MILLPKIPELWVIILSLCQIGAVAAVGSFQLQPRDIHYRINSFKAKYVIADEETAEKVDQISDSCPSLRRKIICCQDPKNKGWIDFLTFYKEAQPLNYTAKTRYNDPLILFFTSGTTGKPKMVQHNLECIKSFHSIGNYWMDLTSNDLVLNMSDPGWSKGIWGGLFVPWTMGAGIFAHHSKLFNTETTLKTLQDYPITTFCAPPTIFRKLIKSDLHRYKFSHLRHCLSAGEPLHAAANEQWRKNTGIYIHEGFGQAETSLICGMYRCIKRKPGSIGKPLPGVQLAILDPYYNELGPGKEGILSVKLKPHAPLSLFKEYLNNQKETDAAFRGDYYLTGDRAYKDEEEYYWFVGRNDDIILSSGYAIGPCEVESALQEHPAVLESAVVSSPDPQGIETVKAFVVLNKEYLHLDKNQMTTDLQDHVKNIASPYKYPRKIEFVDKLPKTVTGKVQRKALRKREWSEVKKEQNISVAS
ncbi:acyl-coenzyme A synthetase ACSM3, mitochondrial-like [Centruroides sculpturatus]|uniref:acyl-coenzyme A synthetase ACSM3, mitochondrial-like n=2 Tax=Centruroides sculpturatus TaxID=218467 RepID=UPI000C6CDD2D|nr:acyl-coenzyme A synthetase ACSM3, mitochondrial-like [Centruroides sculpturatus]